MLFFYFERVKGLISARIITAAGMKDEVEKKRSEGKLKCSTRTGLFIAFVFVQPYQETIRKSFTFVKNYQTESGRWYYYKRESVYL